MGGKSRKSGGVSKKFINNLVKKAGGKGKSSGKDSKGKSNRSLFGNDKNG